MDFIVFTVMSFHTPFLTNYTRLQVWDFNASIKVGVNAAFGHKNVLAHRFNSGKSGSV